MKVDKSLQEAWDWKDQVYLETKNLHAFRNYLWWIFAGVAPKTP